MKVKLSAKNSDKLFGTLDAMGYTSTILSGEIGFHSRTIRDWRRCKFNMPMHAFEKLASIAKIQLSYLEPEYIDEKEQRSKAGSIGGRVQWLKNGTIGSIDDKVKGGKTSYARRLNNENDIYTRIKIKKPIPSCKLAEFVGISMGDGCITDYQVTISLNNEDDKEYINHVVKLSEDLFGVKPSIHNRKHSKCSDIVISSVGLVEFLVALGLPKGDKIRAKLDIPEWIVGDPNLSRACIRGLFDTDGSIFLETHTIKEKKYSYPRMSFVSASEPLRASICELLFTIGYNPKIRMKRSVNLEQFTDIEKYFRIIGSSNQKHLRRFTTFCGGVG